MEYVILPVLIDKTLLFLIGILEKEFDSLSVKDIEALQEVPEALKRRLNNLIAIIKNKERFEVWLTRQGLHPNVVKRYVHLMFTFMYLCLHHSLFPICLQL